MIESFTILFYIINYITVHTSAFTVSRDLCLIIIYLLRSGSQFQIFFVSSDSPLDIVLIAIVLIHSQIVSTVTSRGTSTSPAPAPTAISTSFHAQRAEPVIWRHAVNCVENSTIERKNRNPRPKRNVCAPGGESEFLRRSKSGDQFR